MLLRQARRDCLHGWRPSACRLSLALIGLQRSPRTHRPRFHVATHLKRVYRHISESVCPWNVKFSQELPEGLPFSAREFIAGKAAVALA